MKVTENLKLWGQVAALRKAGKMEEAVAFQKKHIPLPAWGAEVLKKYYGADYVRNSGYILSEAESRFGKNWLDR